MRPKAISRGKVCSNAYEEPTRFLHISFEASLKRFVPTSAESQIPIRFFKLQWRFYDHGNGSGTVGEMAQYRSSSLPAVELEVIDNYCEIRGWCMWRR